MERWTPHREHPSPPPGARAHLNLTERVRKATLALLAGAAVSGSQALAVEGSGEEQQAQTIELIDPVAADAVRRSQIMIQVICDECPADYPVTDDENPFIGPADTIITSPVKGDLEAKKLTLNPQWAAEIVQFIREAGLKPGDTIALGMTSSLPALNVHTYAAVEAFGLKPISILSASASPHGANVVNYPWPHMQRKLTDRGLISRGVAAVSLGGADDDAADHSPQGRVSLRQMIEENNFRFLPAAKTRAEAVQDRIDIYVHQNNGTLPAAFLNVGAGAIPIGGTKGRKNFGSGVVMPDDTKTDSDEPPIESVANAFLEQGRPVINLANILKLAKALGIKKAG